MSKKKKVDWSKVDWVKTFRSASLYYLQVAAIAKGAEIALIILDKDKSPDDIDVLPNG